MISNLLLLKINAIINNLLHLSFHIWWEYIWKVKFLELELLIPRVSAFVMLKDIAILSSSEVVWISSVSYVCECLIPQTLAN